MSTGTVTLHRVLKAPPLRVYRAFIEGEALAKWLPPHGFTCKVEHLEARVGGTFRMAFFNFGTGHSHALRWSRAASSATPTASTTPTCRGRCG